MSLIDVVLIIYISFQVIVTIIVSIVGVNHVRKTTSSRHNNSSEMEIAIQPEYQTSEHHDADKNKIYHHPHPDEQMDTNGYKKTEFCQLWLKIVWKMRSVYCSFAVHVFDVITDILIIIEWWNLEQNGENIKDINAKTMAICGIVVLLFHKIISTIAFWAKEKSISRCVLQFLDLLIFEEIYVSHTKIVYHFRKHLEAVDTTTSFKFVRNLEAVFESIPQSILQLVFIMRTGHIYGNDQNNANTSLLIISTLSIIQSIISMTNSILNNDNIYMNVPKWKKHKQRLPPTVQFFKQALSRLSEVISRIGLFALFWTVCEGTAFGVLLAVELSFIFGLTVMEFYVKRLDQITINELFLRIQALIVLPSELIYEENGADYVFFSCEICHLLKHPMLLIQNLCLTMFCCYWPAVLLSTLCMVRKDHYIHASFRIGTSMIEWTILILCA
eukprot:537086_1